MKKSEIMTIIAITKTGHEYVYKISTAHAVSKRSADEIAGRLNAIGYQLHDGEVWHVYQIDKYDRAFDFAQFQKFTIYKNQIRDHRC